MAVSSHLFAMLRSSGECARLVDFDSTVTLLWTPTAVIILNGSLREHYKVEGIEMGILTSLFQFTLLLGLANAQIVKRPLIKNARDLDESCTRDPNRSCMAGKSLRPNK
ncbi:hypothetical protein I7I51_07103 [Histoplasma capsulatum]|uniref:Uncharacterized protein n=1 Tax=Ajellomyces capsulatus TaxID=5037 RepID=A0A8A1MIC5_AJECA|nr:hypothetical protein I7I51_07103 [Histoplasma capsulatum]